MMDHVNKPLVVDSDKNILYTSNRDMLLGNIDDHIMKAAHVEV